MIVIQYRRSVRPSCRWVYRGLCVADHDGLSADMCAKYVWTRRRYIADRCRCVRTCFVCAPPLVHALPRFSWCSAGSRYPLGPHAFPMHRPFPISIATRMSRCRRVASALCVVAPRARCSTARSFIPIFVSVIPPAIIRLILSPHLPSPPYPFLNLPIYFHLSSPSQPPRLLRTLLSLLPPLPYFLSCPPSRHTCSHCMCRVSFFGTVVSGHSSDVFMRK